MRLFSWGILLIFIAIYGEDMVVVMGQSREFGWKYRVIRWACIRAGRK